MTLGHMRTNIPTSRVFFESTMRSHLGPSTLEICGLFRLERAMKGQRSGAFLVVLTQVYPFKLTLESVTPNS